MLSRSFKGWKLNKGAGDSRRHYLLTGQFLHIAGQRSVDAESRDHVKENPMTTNIYKSRFGWILPVGLSFLPGSQFACGQDPPKPDQEAVIPAADLKDLEEAQAQKKAAAAEQEQAWRRFRACETAKKDAEKRGVSSADEEEGFRRIVGELAKAGREVADKTDALYTANQRLSDIMALRAAAFAEPGNEQPPRQGETTNSDPNKNSGNPLTRLKSQLGQGGPRKSANLGGMPPVPDRPTSPSNPFPGTVDLSEPPMESTDSFEPELEVAGKPRGPSEVESGKRYSLEVDIRNTGTRQLTGWVEVAILIGEGTIEGENPSEVTVPAGKTSTLRWSFVPTRLVDGRLRYGARVLANDELEAIGAAEEELLLEGLSAQLEDIESELGECFRDLENSPEHRRFLISRSELWDAVWKLEDASRNQSGDELLDSLQDEVERLNQTVQRRFEEQEADLRDLRQRALKLPKLEEQAARLLNSIQGRIELPEPTRNAQALRLNSLHHRIRDAQEAMASHTDTASSPLVTDLRGSTFHSRPERPMEALSQDKPLKVGPRDQFQTGSGGSAGVRFPDGARLQLGADSKVAMGESARTQDLFEPTIWDIDAGLARLVKESSLSRSVKRNISFRLQRRNPNRPTAIACPIRGSDVMVQVTRDWTRLLVREGEVELDLGEGKKVIVKAGQEVTFHSEPRAEDVKAMIPKTYEQLLSETIRFR